MKLPQLIRNLFVKDMAQDKREIAVPENLFVTCPNCKKTIYQRRLGKNWNVCPECSYHFVLPTEQWIELIADPKTFKPLLENIKPTDPLEFPNYASKLKKSLKDESAESITTGYCTVDGRTILLGVMNPNFFMGSLGSVAGEKITRLFELGIQHSLPVILVIRSGGARMQEGVLSLMQMAKTSAAIQRFSQQGLLYIPILTHPTTGGVSASFAMLGDLAIAEPESLIGFAGPRVIEQTIKQKLPEGFQKAAYLLEKGFVDLVVSRLELRAKLESILALHPQKPQATLPQILKTSWSRRLIQWFKK